MKNVTIYQMLRQIKIQPYNLDFKKLITMVFNGKKSTNQLHNSMGLDPATILHCAQGEFIGIMPS